MNEDELMSAATRRLEEESSDISVDDDASEVDTNRPEEAPEAAPPAMDGRERLLAYIGSGRAPSNVSVRLYMRRFVTTPERVDALILQLEADRLIEKFQAVKGPAYRLVGGVRTTAAASAPIVQQPPRETTMPQSTEQWVSTDEAAKILAHDKCYVTKLARDGKIQSRKTGPHDRSPREYLRSSLVAYGGGDPEPPPRTPKSKAKAKPLRSPRAAETDLLDQVAAKHVEKAINPEVPLKERLQWVLRGQHMGEFTAEEALHRVSEAIR